MEWMEQFAEYIRAELDAHEGPRNLTSAELQALAGDRPLPPPRFWSSLQAYLIFGLRGIDVEPVLRNRELQSVNFQSKQFSLEWLPVERSVCLRSGHPFQRSGGRTITSKAT